MAGGRCERGDGGSRTRVRRKDHRDHYIHSRSFTLRSAETDRQVAGEVTPGVRASARIRPLPPGGGAGYPAGIRRLFGAWQAGLLETGYLMFS